MASTKARPDRRAQRRGDDRRHFRRYDVDGVEGSLQCSMEIRVLNMSLTGLAIETDIPMRIGQSYPLRVQGNGVNVHITGEVQWCREVRRQTTEHGQVLPIYEVGLDFKEVLNEKARDILHFLEDNIVVELDRRLFGRFHLREAEAVEVALELGFEVRKISFSGMLIETEPDTPLEQGSILELEIRHPKLRMACRGRVVWVGEASASSVAGWRQLGVEYVELAREDRQKLERFIRGLLE